ncbi:MAG: hypothetical protein U9R22_08200 [Pseudomonadota bacterium]|nr:hypothetical protein [Pseudomonadota bacterium]
MAYDSMNRLDVLTYPGPSNRLAVKYLYNGQGYLTHLRNNATNALYYQVVIPPFLTAAKSRG